MTLVLTFLAALLVSVESIRRARTSHQRRAVTRGSHRYLEQSIRDASLSPGCDLDRTST